MAHKLNGSDDHNNNPGKLDRDIANMISTLTHHLTNLGKQMDGSDHAGLGIVTVSGSNKGAVMKAEHLLEDELKMEKFGEEKLSAYTNSNYQAVNNSIMIDGKCEVEDPGVHIEIVEFIDEDKEEKKETRKDKKLKKEKKEKKEKISEKPPEQKGGEGSGSE